MTFLRAIFSAGCTARYVQYDEDITLFVSSGNFEDPLPLVQSNNPESPSLGEIAPLGQNPSQASTQSLERRKGMLKPWISILVRL